MSERKRVVIVGAGPGGICASIRLKHAGYDDFVVLDKAPSIGGTWFHNQYPGCACDVQSHLYSFSFEIKRDWSRPYATQPEILAYMQHCVDKYELAHHIRLSTAVTSAYWDDECTLWRVVTDQGDEIEADVLISALGMFNDLNLPDIEGLDSFRGTTFHSARWPHDHDLSGERIAVIGTAASAVQFLPTVASQAGQLHVFQRSANWVLPKVDDPFTPEQLDQFRIDPIAARELRWEVWRRVENVITFSDPAMLRAAEEAGLRNLETVLDPEVRRKLTPKVPWGCHRPLSSNDYYPIYNQPNVELVTDRIDRVTPAGVITADGVEREVDTIILGTGFKTTRYLAAVDVVGRGGRHLRDLWEDGAHAYMGMAVSGFPNLFMLYGPNTNNGSILFMLECQVSYVLRQLERMEAEGLAWIDVRPEVMDRYNDALQHDLDQVDVWQAACHGYYRSRNGRIVTQWPHTMAEFRDRTMRPDPDAYDAHHGVPLGRL
ncbi:MAG TPA: NAD(P)/FAD-dependent oxidoreductase [Acidimicrobiales bacterium]|jgi:cation diffusion facilitator CzcD-associated flavoprotein CzcO|nr:NAD(P)/FAD-dependent oxidoreductase [Acidimicrobiales bacterium]